MTKIVIFFISAILKYGTTLRMFRLNILQRAARSREE